MDKANSTLYTKLFEIQREIDPIEKNSENPFFKSKYFDINKLLETIKPIFSEMGILLLQPLTHIDGQPAISTILIDIKSGEQISNTTMLPKNPNPQKMGSSITYFRRYSLKSLLGLQSEDDDANLGSSEDKKKLTELRIKINKLLKSMMDEKIFTSRRAVKEDMFDQIGTQELKKCKDVDSLKDYQKYLEEVKKSN